MQEKQYEAVTELWQPHIFVILGNCFAILHHKNKLGGIALREERIGEWQEKK